MIKLLSRASTTTLDAYLNPYIVEYSSKFINSFEDSSKLQVNFMQSDGGLCSLQNFCGSRALLSGPAGGAVGFVETAKFLLKKNLFSLNFKGIIGFDMGGTSTDVSRYDLISHF
jgi:5-oxoprolinase (ATP-hydrolysing)